MRGRKEVPCIDRGHDDEVSEQTNNYAINRNHGPLIHRRGGDDLIT